MRLPVREAAAGPPDTFDAQLTGTDGRQQPYAVVPARQGDMTHWLDPAGFELAVTRIGPEDASRFGSDFKLQIAGHNVTVTRLFRPARR